MTTAPILKDPALKPGHESALRVLVAEDSPVTHDLLKLLLMQRGHEVDIASDGLQALVALRNNHYDVALLDFHMPGMDGLRVAVTLKNEAHGRRLPRLIAITADAEGLLRHEAGCENFDYILPKPLDLNEVAKVVEEQAEIAERAPDEAMLDRQAQTAVTVVAPPRSVLERLKREFLAWPEDIDATRLSSRAMQATRGDKRFDAIVLNEPVPVDDLAIIWMHPALFALPVIDLSGTLGAMADLDASKLAAHEMGQVERLIGRFRERRAHLHRDLLLSDELEDRLLGRIYVAGKPLVATLDPRSRALIAYNLTLAPVAATQEADDLCSKGLLSREFVERFHVCSQCGSERMHARKECPRCRSSHLLEVHYLHHFRCGFQGPRAEFHRGLRLICPKCRRELNDLGIDYDVSATTTICQSCGHAEPQSLIGLVCLDCKAHHEWEVCPTRDAFNYELTDQGFGYAEYGRSFLGLFQKPLRFAELPAELIEALNRAAKTYNENGTSFTLVNIFYKNERAITVEHGVRQFNEARERFLRNLRAALDSSKVVVKGSSSYDFALLAGIDAHQAQREIAGLRESAMSGVRFDLGATLKAFGPEDF